MEEHFVIRTDLALEAREESMDEAGELPGVLLTEEEAAGGEVHISRVVVRSGKGAKAIGKPKGTYLTLEAAELWKNDGGSHREISRAVAEQVRLLLEEADVPEDARILVVGLGNPDMTSDSLGPRVVGNLRITRRLYKDGRVSGIVPGVLAQTGMEAAEIVRGVVRETGPDAVLVIDALAARSVRRLGTTIQLTDTGIQPGSGVGNHRSHLDRVSLGVPVIAIGVPTVVGAAAIVYDAMESLMEEVAEDERYRMIEELVEPRLGPMYVTPKDIDDRVKRISFTISEALNIALQGDAYNKG